MRTADAGYLITEPLFERRKMQELCQVLLEAGLPRTKAGVRHVLGVPAVRALAVTPALVALAESFVGKNALPFRATLFDKSATSNWLVAWHQDTALPLEHRVDDTSWGPSSIKGGVL